MNATSKGSSWKLFGLFGAVLAPIIMAILTLSPIPRDTALFQITQNIVFYGAWPVMMFIYKGLPALGIKGDQGLAYMVPIFIVFFLYWALVGYILGAFLARVIKMMKRHNKALQAIGDKSPQPER